MKELSVTYTGDWMTTLEVPDDFVPSKENVAKFIADNKQDFNFNDGGASWFLECIQDENGEYIDLN